MVLLFYKFHHIGNKEIILKLILSPKLNVYQFLEEKRKLNPKFDIENIISEILPKRLAQIICSENKVSGNISEYLIKS